MFPFTNKSSSQQCVAPATKHGLQCPIVGNIFIPPPYGPHSPRRDLPRIFRGQSQHTLNVININFLVPVNMAHLVIKGRHEFQIADSIVVLDAIYVMNIFMRLQQPPKMLFNDKSMFIYISVFIAMWVNRLTAQNITGRMMFKAKNGPCFHGASSENPTIMSIAIAATLSKFVAAYKSARYRRWSNSHWQINALISIIPIPMSTTKTALPSSVTACDSTRAHKSIITFTCPWCKAVLIKEYPWDNWQCFECGWK